MVIRHSNSNKWSVIFLAVALSGPPRPRFRTATDLFFVSYDFSALFEIIIWGIIGIFVVKKYLDRILLKKTPYPNYYLFGSAKVYFIYALLALFSTVYSILPFYTLFFSYKFIVLCLLSYLVAEDANSPWRLFNLAFILSIIIVSIQAVLYLIDPNLVGIQTKSFYRMTGGVFGGYGIYALITFIGTSIILRRKSNLKINNYLVLFFYQVLAVIFIFLSRTRQTIFFLIIWLIIYYIFDRNIRFRNIYMIFLSGITILLIIYLNLHHEILVFLIRDFDSLRTLSSRTIIFSHILDHLDDFLPWGDGFVAGSRYWLYYLNFADIGLGNAHDSISAVLVELGIPGAVFLSITFFMGCFQIMKITFKKQENLSKFENYHLLKLILIFAFIYSFATIFTNPSFAQGSWVWLFTFLTINKL